MWALVLGRGGFEPPKALGQLIYIQSRLTASVSARPRDFTDNRRDGDTALDLVAGTHYAQHGALHRRRVEWGVRVLGTDPPSSPGSPLYRPLPGRGRRR